MNQLLPGFTSDGVLPVGDYELTIDGLRNSMLVLGNGGTWDVEWRRELVDNLEILVIDLWSVGIENIFIDGSFVEEKPRPNDIDGYFEVDRQLYEFGHLEPLLNSAHRKNGGTKKIWGWDVPFRRRRRDSVYKTELIMWHEFRVELHPHHDGKHTGIFDEYGNEMLYPAAFRKTKEPDGSGAYIQKGIVKLVKSGNYHDQD